MQVVGESFSQLSHTLLGAGPSKLFIPALYLVRLTRLSRVQTLFSGSFWVIMSATEQDSSPRKRRVYFCRPCGHRHPSPTNAKCQLHKAEIHDQPDQTSENEGSIPVQPAKRRRCSRSIASGSSRTRSGKQRALTGNGSRAKVRWKPLLPDVNVVIHHPLTRAPPGTSLKMNCQTRVQCRSQR